MAQSLFATRVSVPASGQWSSLQYDYLAAYLDFYSPEGPRAAAAIAARYKDYPVPKWAAKFNAVAEQLQESVSIDTESLSAAAGLARRMDKLADTEPALSMAVSAGVVTVTYTNLTAVRINVYPMDIELLFSNK